MEVSALPLIQSTPGLKAALSVYSSQQLIPTAASRELVGGSEDHTAARLLDQSLKQAIVQHCIGEMEQALNLQITQCKLAIDDHHQLELRKQWSPLPNREADMSSEHRDLESPFVMVSASGEEGFTNLCNRFLTDLGLSDTKQSQVSSPDSA